MLICGISAAANEIDIVTDLASIPDEEGAAAEGKNASAVDYYTTLYHLGGTLLRDPK